MARAVDELDGKLIRLLQQDARWSSEVLAKLIMELVGTRVEPVYEKARPRDIRHSLADISKARQLGYHPQYTLRMGLAETIVHLAAT